MVLLVSARYYVNLRSLGEVLRQTGCGLARPGMVGHAMAGSESGPLAQSRLVRVCLSNGMLTHTIKIRRSRIEGAVSDKLEAWYAGGKKVNRA